MGEYMQKSILKKDSYVLKKFKRQKVITIEQLAADLNCSTPTARRRLILWHTHTSYNHNGRYYVLTDVAKFDQHGMWCYQDILFSKYGNLKNTVIQLVSHSDAGLKAMEIEKLVRLSSRSFLSHFRNIPALHREKIDGYFVYFSSNETILIKQRQKRDEQISRKRQIQFPTDAEATIILVERIKHPELPIKTFCNILKKQGCAISVEAATHFFEHHGILKKTSDMPSLKS